MGGVRTSPVLGSKAWFGPRRLGWGLEPVSPEGWLVTLAFAGVAIAARRYKVGAGWARYVVLGVFMLLAVMKGSAPGGPGARSDFDAARFPAAPPSGEDPLLLS
jgi:hypothetical protein